MCRPEIIPEGVVEIGQQVPVSPAHPVKLPISKSEFVQADCKQNN